MRGLEKVEDKWGISIWETEIFGPKSHNLNAITSKEDYLSVEVKEGESEKVAARIKDLAAPVVSITEKPFQHGVVYTSWTDDELLMPASDMTLADLKEMGIDTVSIMVPAYQTDLTSREVYTNDKPGGDTPTDAALKHSIEVCHKLGMRVLLKVHVDPRTDEARIDIVPSEGWFSSYGKLVLRYAVLAEDTGVEIFSVGTELEGTTFDAWDAHWREIIRKIKEVYSGVLTYSANWTEYKGVPFWDTMDMIGIDAYFPLTEKDDATVEELMAGWEKHADEIEEWLTEKGLTEKGVILTEIGYTSTDGTNRQPWVAISRMEDQQEQADCLQATLAVFSERPWFKGYYWWQYMPQERWSPLGFTINGKKAEGVLAEWIKKLSGKTMREVPVTTE